jgi:hypothetical protein
LIEKNKFQVECRESVNLDISEGNKSQMLSMTDKGKYKWSGSFEELKQHIFLWQIGTVIPIQSMITHIYMPRF